MIIDSECENESDTAEDTQSNSSEWSCTESEEKPPKIQFIPGEKSTGVSSNIKGPLNFFKLFFLPMILGSSFEIIVKQMLS